MGVQHARMIVKRAGDYSGSFGIKMDFRALLARIIYIHLGICYNSAE